MRIFVPFTIRSLVPRFNRSFLQKEVIKNPLSEAPKNTPVSNIYRTKTGQISMGLYEVLYLNI
jgi:hypothetical protein